MRRTFGLTALLLVTLAVLAVAGCTGNADSGAGLIQPFATGTPGPGPSISPKPSPSVSPLPAGLANVVTSLNNPTRMAFWAKNLSLYYLQGYQLGSNQGRLFRTAYDTQNNESQSDPDSPQEIAIEEINARGEVQARALTMSNPVWMTLAEVNQPGKPIDGDYFLVTDNFGTNQGRVLMIKPDPDRPEATALDLGQYAPSPPVNPMAVCHDGGKYIFWTEYTGTPQGRVRRADISQDPPVVIDYLVGLDFPAGLDALAGKVAVAQNGASSVVVTDIEPENGTYPIPLASARILTAAVGDPVMLRPFEVRWAAGESLVILDGFALSVVGGPLPAGPGNGNLRYYPGPEDLNWSNRTVNLVKGDLTDPVGLGMIYQKTDGNEPYLDVAFVQSVVAAGTANRIRFKTAQFPPFPILADKQLSTGLSRGFQVLSVGTWNVPTEPVNLLIYLSRGFDMGQANGSIVRYTGPFEP